MIFDPVMQTVVGNMGWVDNGSLWTFDVRSQAEGHLTIAGAKYLSLRPGANGLFRLVHHGSPDQTISIRYTSEPGHELASVRLSKHPPTFLGDIDLWRFVDPAVIVSTGSGQRLVKIDAQNRGIIDLDLSWFTNGAYDLNYQGLVDCISIEAIECILVSVQRSSDVIVVDPKSNKRAGSIRLGGHVGNPQLRLCSQHELIASDYDTLCRVDCRSMILLESVRLQSTAQFIGEFDLGHSACVVARPFSGDVVLLDLDDFHVLGKAPIGGQPLTVCMVSETRVVARDWKSGRVMMGEFSV